MHWLLPVLVVAAVSSLVAAGAMHLDKKRAQRRGPRIRERIFVVYALLGGWVGIVAAGIAFRHKTQARAFQVKVAVAAVVHATALGVAVWWSS